jgi:hypothetical protein
MAPAVAAALISAIPAVAKGVTGLAQGAKGRRLEREAGERPEYEIPQEVLQALEGYKTRASQTRLPGQSAIEQGIRSSTASTAGKLEEAAGSSASLLGALAQTGVGEQQSMRDLGLKSSQYQYQTQEELLDYLSKIGQYRDKEFALNEMEPWKQAMGASSAMKGAGMQNVMTGISDSAGLGMNYLQGERLNELLGLLPKKGLNANADSLGVNTDLNVSNINYEPQFSMGGLQESSLNSLGVDTDGISKFLDSMGAFNKLKFNS